MNDQGCRISPSTRELGRNPHTSNVGGRAPSRPCSAPSQSFVMPADTGEGGKECPQFSNKGLQAPCCHFNSKRLQAPCCHFNNKGHEARCLNECPAPGGDGSQNGRGLGAVRLKHGLTNTGIDLRFSPNVSVRLRPSRASHSRSSTSVSLLGRVLFHMARW